MSIYILLLTGVALAFGAAWHDTPTE